MPETFRRYQTWQAAIATSGRTPTAAGHERFQEGDIITIRKPLPGIARGGGAFLWMLLDGEDDNIMSELNQHLFEPAATFDEVGGWSNKDSMIYDKRRFQIPLDRLNGISPFDVSRARDSSDRYQPFIPLDEDNGFILEGSSRPPLDIRGLVFDRATDRYL